METAAKRVLDLQSGTQHAETENKVSDGVKPQKDKSSIKCYFCHLCGHFAAECRKRKADQVANLGKGRRNSKGHFGSNKARDQFRTENVHNVCDTPDEEDTTEYTLYQAATKSCVFSIEWRRSVYGVGYGSQ